MRSNTGPMTNSVRNSAMATSTWLGGACCVPSAWRSSDSTITMRVKLVISSSAAGRNDRDVSSSSVCRLRLYSWPPPGVGVLVMAGRPCACAAIGRTNAASNATDRSLTERLTGTIALFNYLLHPRGEVVGRRRGAGGGFLPGQGAQRIHPAGSNADDDPQIGDFDHYYAFAIADADAADDFGGRRRLQAGSKAGAFQKPGDACDQPQHQYQAGQHRQ